MPAYTDKELQLATQVAYAELGEAYEYLCDKTGQTSFTLSELRTTALELDHGANVDQLNDLTETQLNTWRISSVRDTNSTTGFYACVIDTGNGNGIAAFRGSEAMGTTPEQLSNIQHDWIQADLGLLNSTTTNQYTEARKFLMDNADLLNSYDQLSMTGHSLGGNLAEFSTIVCDDYGIGRNLDRTVSYDGPGFSNDFIDYYRGQIDRNAGKVDHYRWSFVGSMLHTLPGEHDQFIRVKPDAHCGDVGKWFLGGFTRHSTSAIDFDENGNVQRGHQDPIAWGCEHFSKLIDALPAPIGDTVSGILAAGLMIGFEHPVLTIGAVILTAITHPVLAAQVIGTFLVIVAVEFAVEIGSYLIDVIVNFVNSVVTAVTNWVQEKVAEFCAFVREKAAELVDGLRKFFDKEYRAAQAYLDDHSLLEFHTQDLRALAERLWRVNDRLNALDERIDGLYSRVHWTDLLKLMSSDWKIGWSKRINGCANALSSTADRFESAEQQILSLIG